MSRGTPLARTCTARSAVAASLPAPSLRDERREARAGASARLASRGEHGDAGSLFPKGVCSFATGRAAFRRRGPGALARRLGVREPPRLACTTDPRTDVARATMARAAMCVRNVDDQGVLQFTLILAAGCVLHRRTSRVIHRQELCQFLVELHDLPSRAEHQDNRYEKGFPRWGASGGREGGQVSLIPPHPAGPRGKPSGGTPPFGASGTAFAGPGRPHPEDGNSPSRTGPPTWHSPTL